MTVEELIQALRDLLQEHDPEGRFSNEELTRYIEAAGRRVATDLKLLVDEAEVTVPAGKRLVGLPPDYVAFDDWLEPPPVPVDIRGGKILLQSKPSEDITLSFTYFRLPHDVSEIPDRCMDGVLFAAHFLALTSETAAPESVTVGERKDAEARYERWLAYALRQEPSAAYRWPTSIKMWRRR